MITSPSREREARKIQHLHLRAGFGIHPADLRRRISEGLEASITRLEKDSQPYRPLNLLKDIRSNSKPFGSIRILRQVLRSTYDLQRLNVEWTNRMGSSKGVFRERMTYFWHNHFATHVPFAVLMQEQNNTQRKLALGSFSDLLLAMAKDPAMILFLNNQQNKKNAPNENFARELLELFTLGIGHYTEKDIKEAARAFTGWQVNLNGYYEFNPEDHDHGDKTFLGLTGRWTGEDILKIILSQPQLARFICTKLYREFVHPEPDPEKVDAMATYFRKTNYHVGELMHWLFSSEWFYEEKNMASRIKSPVELLAGMKRLNNLRWVNPMNQVRIQKALGQVLFFPPNVAGWPGDKNWIDSSSLLIRMNLPVWLFSKRKNPFVIETRQDAEMEIKGKERRMFEVKADWKPLAAVYGRDLIACADDLVNDLISLPIEVTLRMKRSEIEEPVDPIALLVAQIMAYPEYQLC